MIDFSFPYPFALSRGLFLPQFLLYCTLLTMRKKKLFIGIPVSRDVFRRLERVVNTFSDLPVRWSLPENYHITVLYLGHVHPDDVSWISQNLSDLFCDIESFDVVLDQVCFSGSSNDPKVVWATGPDNDQMQLIYQRILHALNLTQESVCSFRPHIMLGRVGQKRWEALLEKPVVDVPVSLSVDVSSVVLFESMVQEGKLHHELLDEFFLSE